MITPPPSDLLLEVRGDRNGARLNTQLPPAQALQLLNTVAEQLRLELAVQAVEERQRVKVAGPAEMPDPSFLLNGGRRRDS